MFLRSQVRKKDGQAHAYWRVVENKRLQDGRVAQRQVLYLGEVNDSQRAGWRKTLAGHTTGSDATSHNPMFGLAALARSAINSAAVRPWIAQWSLFCAVAKKCCVMPACSSQSATQKAPRNPRRRTSC